MKYFALLLAVALGSTFPLSLSAQVVFFDDFSGVGDGTLLDGRTPIISGVGTWDVTQGNTQTIVGGVVDTATNAASAVSAFGGPNAGSFTDTLSAGEQLKFSFSTVKSAGNFFGGAFPDLTSTQEAHHEFLFAVPTRFGDR